MPDFNATFKAGALGSQDGMPVEPKAKLTGEPGVPAPLGTYDDDDLLDLWSKIRKEALDSRWIFERQWMRNIYYVLGRQWIEYHSRQGGWKDKRLAQWIPRPVTNKCKETVQAIRAMFTAIKLGVNARPNGTAPENVAAAATADELAPLIHEEHRMNAVLNEFDFWLIVTGNAFLHTYVDYDMKHGLVSIPHETCLTCGETFSQDKLAGNVCPTPECGGTTFEPAMNPDGTPMVTERPKGKPLTIALSPLELAFPNSYARFEDLPYVVRLRWRPRSYYENHPTLKTLVSKIAWQKSPQDQSLQLFKSLANHNDLGIAPIYWSEGMTTGGNEDGVPEYEVWYKPCEAYPKGLVFRVIGDQKPLIAHLEEDEAIPGPMPYTDAEETPLFPYMHAGYEHVGGRVLASGPLDVIIQKQDQLNQLDSMILLIIMRMANPVWLEPKGAEIERLTGMPGLVVKWNPLTVGGNAKPERIPGEGPHPSLFTIREQYLKDIEELAGTFDIIKGAKPTGVEAFSALQLLVERSQSRFAGVFTARADAYKNWYKIAIELEREFGPDEKTKWVLSDARQWTYQSFKRAQLQGSVTMVVEDGSTIPKTSLGMRAAVQQASALNMLNMADPDVQYEGLKLFGLTKMVPTLDIDVQSALQKHRAFEDWVANPKAMQQSMLQTRQSMLQYQDQVRALPADPTGMMPIPAAPSPLMSTPLKWRKWYNPLIHRQEFLKWANSDRVRQLLTERPELEHFLDLHLEEINAALREELARQAMMTAPMAKPSGGAMAMENSNRESTSGVEPSGSSESNQGQGPA